MLAHAITDAILGAAALGDIGMHFPDTDPAMEGLRQPGVPAPRAENWRRSGAIRIVNVDSTVILERPKLKDFRQTDPRAAGGDAGAGLDRVSVKFKTAEKVGPVGEGRSAKPRPS